MTIPLTEAPTITHTTLIDEILPVYEFSDVNTTVVRATPQEIMQAYATVTLGEITVMRPLFTLRGLPARLARREPALNMPGDEPFSRWSLASGSPWIVLGDEPLEQVIGAVGTFAQLSIEFVTIADASRFKSFDDPALTKTVLGVRVIPGGNSISGYTFVIESRTHVVDPELQRRFAVYWRLIRPFEAMMARGALAAVKRRAEGTPERPAGHHRLRFVASALGYSIAASLLMTRVRHRAKPALPITERRP